MAEIFVSYTSKDRDWAEWIGLELEKLGHVARIDAWEISGGGDIAKWMDEQFNKADHILCVISRTYLDMPHASSERRAAEWAARTGRPNFALPVRIEDCALPLLLDPIKRCNLFDHDEDGARAALAEFLAAVGKPKGPMRFPGIAIADARPQGALVFPGQKVEGAPRAISNIPINVPRHFLGRDDDLASIGKALDTGESRAAITTLHGLRGVGKTVLAAAYAERHSRDYHVTWWIRAETEPTIRADLVGLGVRLGWIPPDAREEHAVGATLLRLQEEGENILLIYDNAVGPHELARFLPRGSGPHIIVTSNAPNWSRLAVPIEIEVWPKETGADFLISRVSGEDERTGATMLSEALGGLPLAHEQAAAYCERIGVSLVEYGKRLEVTPTALLDSRSDAVDEYHDGLTVEKTFALAIGEAAKRHPAAEALITYAALLAAEPIPLYLFSEARGEFAASFASQIVGSGLDDAVAALRAFALVDRESIPDERDMSVATDCIRLHRLVREVAAGRLDVIALPRVRQELLNAMAKTYPRSVFNDPVAWPKARRLDPIAMALVDKSEPLPGGAEAAGGYILNLLAFYRQGALALYPAARSYFERALATYETTFGPDDRRSITCLNNLCRLLYVQGENLEAQPYCERALAAAESALGPEDFETSVSLINLGAVLRARGDFAQALPCFERALALRERLLGAEHPETASCLGSLGYLLREWGDLGGARRYYERALAIYQKVLDPNHPDTARSLYNLGTLLGLQGNLVESRRYCERGLAICETALGPEHPDTARGLNNVGYLQHEAGNLADARKCYQRALTIYERVLGPEHFDTKLVARNCAALMDELGLASEAQTLREKFGIVGELQSFPTPTRPTDRK